MKKLYLYLSAILLVGLKPVMAAVPEPGFNLGYIFELLHGILGHISTLFGMAWLGPENVIGFLKFLLWILVFILFFAIGRLLFAKFDDGDGRFGRKMALIVALVFATATTLITPASVIATVFSMYATVIIFILMALVLGGTIYFLYGDALRDAVGEGRLLHAIRALALIVCWWILAKISTGADALHPDITTFQYIFLLVSIIKTRKKVK